MEEFWNVCHDAYVLGFEVSTVHDHFDTITVIAESSDFLEIYGSKKVKVIFKNCYSAQMNLQMWIVGFDTLRSFEIVENSTLIPNDAIGVENILFKHYRFNLNTSNSTMDIVAKTIDVQKY